MMILNIVNFIIMSRCNVSYLYFI